MHKPNPPNASEPNQVLLYSPRSGGWLSFHQPRVVLQTYRLDEIPTLLAEIDQQVNQHGLYAAGFVAYEAAPAFDRALVVRDPDPHGLPLLWFGLYAEPIYLPAAGVGLGLKTPVDPNVPPLIWSPELSQHGYTNAIRTIRRHIARGDTYQVNFTYRLRAKGGFPAYATFVSLAGYHRAAYTAFLETEAWAVCSISPELFFTLDGETITSRPMKGTAGRGLNHADDARAADWLFNSEKNRAENVMIVDMVRNDLGRICHTGSVKVPQLFQVEKYPTVWQLTSTVVGATKAPIGEIFNALFPCASITGAPKIRTMQIIAGLETSPRQVYTGAIGYLAPQRQAQFNVAIRTLVLDKTRQVSEYGVGGGIVWDSRPADEWDETRHKARILSERPLPFALLETLRWTPAAAWFLLEAHLARLADSADYFGYALDLPALRQKLYDLAANFPPAAQRVRLRLEPGGEIHLEAQPLRLEQNPRTLGLAFKPVSASDRFLYHKTTRRDAYEQARRERPDCADTLLWNTQGEVTESTIANLVVKLDGQLYTPPVTCGLLAGIYRGWLLAQGRVRERVITVAELPRCQAVYLVNSVRGMWAVELRIAENEIKHL
jgi:para-aminobenzoate synthetase / 4-amino-4-deoxychorismate lyase